MCGIAAVYGDFAAVKSLLLTLNQLERGRQGCGVAYVTNNHIKILKEPIDPTLFSEIWIKELNVNTKVAISHNRLPSVGKVSYENTHPFLSCDNNFAFAHNGHRYNHYLRDQLKANGHEIIGETDSEILMHILEDRLKEHGDMPTAIQDLILNHLNGTIVILTKKGELYIAVAELAM
jgi:glucosamine--fructose-6-phosphate aminotransferase (isomerizing)